MSINSMCAVIPAKKKSVRVPQKNIASFGDSNLLVRKIRQIISLVDKVYVSSDCCEILEAARKEGAVPLLRPSVFAADDTPMSDVYVHIAELLKEETILFTHVTNPFCDEKTYAKCLDVYQSESKHDSLTTVSDVKEFLYWDGNPINFDPRKKPRSQDLPNIVKLNHAVSIIPRELMIETKNIVGHNPNFLTLSQMESIDIDTPFDFELARLLVNRDAN